MRLAVAGVGSVCARHDSDGRDDGAWSGQAVGFLRGSVAARLGAGRVGGPGEELRCSSLVWYRRVVSWPSGEAP